MNREVISDLFVFSNSGSGSYLLRSDKNYIDNLIDKILIEIKLYTAELEAKVYTYEKIIANSNFKSVLSKDKQALEKRVKELEKLQELEGNNE